AREGEDREAPAQDVGRRVRRGIGEGLEREGLGVPERVTAVTGPGESLCGDRPLLSARGRLQDVEQGEADGLLDLRVAFDLDVRTRPVVGEVFLLRGGEGPPAVVGRGGERALDLRTEGGGGA